MIFKIITDIIITIIVVIIDYKVRRKDFSMEDVVTTTPK